jgi:hypothetical protein
MIWSDPWIDLAVQPEGTLLPPLPYEFREGERFLCVVAADMNDGDLLSWATFVGTSWSLPALRARLSDACWIARFFEGETLRSTCVFRRRSLGRKSLWLLETLVARPQGRRGIAPLLRAGLLWIWRTAGPFTLGYTWELSLLGLGVAWWRGWIRSAAAIEYGWVWSPAGSGSGSGCSFCPGSTAVETKEPSSLPQLLRRDTWSVIVSDSGLSDGWGYVSLIQGEPDWSAVAAHGGWRALWYRGTAAPAASAPSSPAESRWRWSGECVVVGLLNHRSQQWPTVWPTAEIAYSSRPVLTQVQGSGYP